MEVKGCDIECSYEPKKPVKNFLKYCDKAVIYACKVWSRVFNLPNPADCDVDFVRKSSVDDEN